MLRKIALGILYFIPFMALANNIVYYNNEFCAIHFDSVKSTGYVYLHPIRTDEEAISLTSFNIEKYLHDSTELSNYRWDLFMNEENEYLIDNTKRPIRLKYFGHPLLRNAPPPDSFYVNCLYAFRKLIMEGSTLDSCYIDFRFGTEVELYKSLMIDTLPSLSIKNSVIYLFNGITKQYKSAIDIANSTIVSLGFINADIFQLNAYNNFVISSISLESCLLKNWCAFFNHTENPLAGTLSKTDLKVYIYKCKFFKKVEIWSSMSAELNIYDSEFLDSVQIHSTYYASFLLLNCKFYDLIKLSGNLIEPTKTINGYNTYYSIYSCEFHNRVECFLNPIVIKYIIQPDSKQQTYDWFPNFGTSYFATNTIFLVYPDYKAIYWGLNERNLTKILLFPVNHDASLTKVDLYEFETYYEELKSDLNLKDGINGKTIDEISNRIDYTYQLAKGEYLRKNLTDSYNLFTYLWSQFLFLTVNQGYHGEANIIWTVFFIIIAFALIYLFFFKTYINYYVVHDKFGGSSLDVAIPKFSFLAFIHSLWFSFYIFIIPKFPFKYFKFPNRMLYVVLLNWMLGVFFLLLFLVFIASKYDFIKDLLGI